jgi:hypothetical protein
MPEPESKRLHVEIAEVVVGALAAVSAAFIASTLGVLGTLLGAAVMSVVATVGAKLYHHSLEQAYARLQRRQPPRPGPPTPVAPEPPLPAPRPIAWGRVAAIAGLAFGLALGMITAVEVSVHQPLAAIVQRPPAETPGPPAARHSRPALPPATTLGRLLQPRPAEAPVPTTPTPAASGRAAASPGPTPRPGQPTPTAASPADPTLPAETESPPATETELTPTAETVSPPAPEPELTPPP